MELGTRQTEPQAVDLAAYAANVHSQSGEDGILAEVFRRLGVAQGYFTEFGAWDGIHLSNSYALAEQGWAGCYIEGDPERFRQLCSNVPQSTISKVKRYLSPDGADSLDSILAEVGAPQEIDLLSIDIDGDDLAIWRSVVTHHPRCVVIEFNPTIPFDCLFENPRGHSWGNSARSIDEFAYQAGYALVAVTHANLIYLDAEAMESTGLLAIELSDVPAGTRYFWGFDGTLLVSQADDETTSNCAPELFRVPWSRTFVTQPLSRTLRRYHDGQSLLVRARSLLATAVAVISRPGSVITELRGRVKNR